MASVVASDQQLIANASLDWSPASRPEDGEHPEDDAADEPLRCLERCDTEEWWPVYDPHKGQAHVAIRPEPLMFMGPVNDDWSMCGPPPEACGAHYFPGMFPCSTGPGMPGQVLQPAIFTSQENFSDCSTMSSAGTGTPTLESRGSTPRASALSLPGVPPGTFGAAAAPQKEASGSPAESVEDAKKPPPDWGNTTTLMMRNLPNKYSQSMLLTDIRSVSFDGAFDFFYLPMDHLTGANRGYSFINFKEPGKAWSFKQHYEGQRMSRFNSEKVISVSPAALQGYDANYAHYANSRVNRGDPSCRPLFLRDGDCSPEARALARGSPRSDHYERRDERRRGKSHQFFDKRASR